ncbi:secreted aspartic proteinase precursor [Xylaria nigripes]|nr:secreted aspartic proteinase precursor [Xylaria nigripes]
MVCQSSRLVFTAALAGLATASPVEQRVGAFSVPQVPNLRFRHHGPSQMAKTLAKYGVPLPDSLAQTVARLDATRHVARDSGSAEAVPEEFDIEYLTPVQIGTPPQTLHLDFDSGSSDLWVFSTETDPRSVDGQVKYDPGKSSTAKKVKDASWEITYGDGSSSRGDVYHDTVTVGGVTVKNHGVEVATQLSQQFTRDSSNDGLLGLAFSSLNTVQPKQELTWFDNAAKSLDAPLWTADLKYHRAGSYDFGVIDKSKHTGSITYVDVNSSHGFWMVDLTGYGIDNTTFKETRFQGIADTGTTLAMLPARVVKSYYDAVSGSKIDDTQGGYVFPCNAHLPDLVLGVGGAKITIPGKYINYAPADTTGDTCFGGVQSDDSIGFSILGDVVLKAVFVVFDKSGRTPRLGLAAKRVV